MINKKEFYNSNELPKQFQKKRMWKNVRLSLKSEKESGFYFDTKNFSLGFGFAILMLFAVLGISSVTKNIFELKKPEIVKLNEAYSNAIKYFEKNSSIETNLFASSVNLDEAFSERKEQLRTINGAITEFTIGNSKNDYSKLEQLKLNELYKIKLDLLTKLIKIKEQQL